MVIGASQGQQTRQTAHNKLVALSNEADSTAEMLGLVLAL